MTTHIPRGAPGRRPGVAPTAPNLKPGGLVFFGGCTHTTKLNEQPMLFRGHGFGIFLGVVPRGAKPPTREMLDPMLASIGWVSFENLIEFLGEEQFKIVEEKFREKYHVEAVPEGEAMPHAATPIEEESLSLPEPASTLLGANGRPVVRDEENDSTNHV